MVGCSLMANILLRRDNFGKNTLIFVSLNFEYLLNYKIKFWILLCIAFKIFLCCELYYDYFVLFFSLFWLKTVMAARKLLKVRKTAITETL